MKKTKIVINYQKLILPALIALVIIILPIWGDYIGWFGSSEQKSIVIPQGAGTTEVANILKEQRIISHSFLFKSSVRSMGKAAEIKAGTHKLSSRMSYASIVRRICQVPAEEGVKVLIPEGYELRQIAAALEEKGLVSAAKFIKEANTGSFDTEKYPFLNYITRKEGRLEGYLFPATYTIPTNYTEHDIICMMLDKFNYEFDAACYQKAAEIGMTVDEVITLASIIEREAVGDSDRDKVSSVFHNRLNSSSYPYLESCATVQYILGERKTVLSIADTKIKSPYNTYQNPGLPIGPIAMPGKESILSTLNPAKTDYFFFVYKNGQHIFSRTLEEHNNAQQ